MRTIRRLLWCNNKHGTCAIIIVSLALAVGYWNDHVSMTRTAETACDEGTIIELLGLQRLPMEGGFFRETYRSRITLEWDSQAGRNQGKRTSMTAIYYLITATEGSCMHRLTSDEIWHFYSGDPVEILLLSPDGSGRLVVLGDDISKGCRPQLLVQKGVWQGARVRSGGRYALVGVTMSPGFEPEDFQIGSTEQLSVRWPSFAAVIEDLNRRRTP